MPSGCSQIAFVGRVTFGCILCAGRRGDVEQGKGESLAPGVTKQRLVNADARWGDTGTTENLSHGQQRPSSLQGPGPRTPRAPPPAGKRMLLRCKKAPAQLASCRVPLQEASPSQMRVVAMMMPWCDLSEILAAW